MAESKFYGTIEARSTGRRGQSVTSRTANDHMEVKLYTKEGDLRIYAWGDNRITISVHPHGGSENGQGAMLFSGHITELLTPEGRSAIVRGFAEQALHNQAKGDNT